MEQPKLGQSSPDKKRQLESIKNFLEPSEAADQSEYYGPVKPILGPELSVANLDREDMLSFMRTVYCAQEMMAHGQDDLALFIMTTMTAELKLTMSIDARVLDNIFSDKIEYSQKQELHEYQHEMEGKKRGLFGRKPQKPTE